MSKIKDFVIRIATKVLYPSHLYEHPSIDKSRDKEATMQPSTIEQDMAEYLIEKDKQLGINMKQSLKLAKDITSFIEKSKMILIMEDKYKELIKGKENEQKKLEEFMEMINAQNTDQRL